LSSDLRPELKIRDDEEDFMTIQWMKGVDAALREARAKGKPLLLDFNAAPM